MFVDEALVLVALRDAQSTVLVRGVPFDARANGLARWEAKQLLIVISIVHTVSNITLGQRDW